MSRNALLWTLWIVLVTPVGILGVVVIVYGGNRSIFLIGQTTSGHHQIELACDACHTSIFGGPEALQNACVSCHGAELKEARDSHPQSKFTDPRNAARTAKLDARFCVTCHREHRPGITHAMAVTLPNDFCFTCHQDIGADRPSHKGLAFTTCASAGCHNFHDNRALYQDFLEKGDGQPDQLKAQRVALVRWLADNEEPPEKPPLTAAQADAPEEHRGDPDIIAAWAGDAHARAGINCSGCHATEAESARWIEAPGLQTCKSCHADEARTFTEGKHGMRLRDGLLATRDGPLGLFKATPLPPMTPADARIPMKAAVHGTALGCATCHGAHDFDTQKASVEACLCCHDDTHSTAFKGSPHDTLHAKEVAGQLPPGSGVTCATCHMPRLRMRQKDGTRKVVVMHNQNDTLRPNEKMARSVCGDCHGLPFTLDALADPALITNNFAGHPSVHVESIEWALRHAERRRAEKRRQ